MATTVTMVSVFVAPTEKWKKERGYSRALLVKRSLAMKKGLPIPGVFRSFAVTVVDPAVMGIGSAVAIPEAVKSAGLAVEDIDLYEINEAFASQYVYCIKKLNLDPEKVNVNGGAIALGHPLGATVVFERGDCVEELCNAQQAFGSQTCIGFLINSVA